ncbi:MAG TPA: ATP-binding protein [Flavisolibacter sp.]|nr:ATP-binding protein [Flavisolibacter sp.]
MKIKQSEIDATPSKRMFLSIISDYHIKSSLCELIDNAIDNWINNGKKSKLTVNIIFDYRQQFISASDNSGGVKDSDLRVIVAPGFSNNSGLGNTIGIFGVGSKRSVIALAERINIYTRYKQEKTYLIELDKHWLEDDSTWHFTPYLVDNIAPNTTIVELTKLRIELSKDREQKLIEELGATYALMLASDDFLLKINTTPVKPISFESWSYPVGSEPRQIITEIDTSEFGKVSVDISAALTKSGDPTGGEYGAYFYCNKRLISRAYKEYEIGFRPLKVGYPHPSVGIIRAIVKINGSAQAMPWNSSKSEINSNHEVFLKIKDIIERLLVYYATLAKRFSVGGGWPDNVFKYSTGVIKSEVVDNSTVKLYIPSIPRTVTPKYPDLIKKANRDLAKNKPWTKGLYEAIIAVNELPKLKLEQNNRLSLLIVDSTLEIAFKDYLVNESGSTYSESRLAGIMNDRKQVHNEIKNLIRLNKQSWKKIEYIYKLRCELVHKRISVTITDEELQNFRDVVEYVLHKMFNLKFN